MKRLLSIILSAAMLSSVALLSSCSRETQFSRTDITVFDTQTIILGYETDESVFEERADDIIEKLRYYHSLYDIYKEYDGINNLKTVNDMAGIEPVKVDSAIIDLLLYSKEMYLLTDGMTNVAMGSVLSIWHDYRERGINDPENARIPPMDELEEAALHTDIDKIIIDEEAKTVLKRFSYDKYTMIAVLDEKMNIFGTVTETKLIESMSMDKILTLLDFLSTTFPSRAIS